MDSLPYEILVHIFQFLPLSSRKKIRLVNRNFNNACNDPSLLKTELFCIPAYFVLDDSFIAEVFSTLAKSQRSIINLKLFKFPLCEELGHSLFSEINASSSFWQNHGTKVRSLELSSFGIEMDALVKILKCCSNLKFCWFDSLSFSQEIWKTLSNDHVILDKVMSLILNSSYTVNCPHEALAQVFPRIQELSIHLKYSDHWTRHECMNSYLETLNYVLKLSPNLQYLNLGFSKFHMSDSNSDLPERESVTRILGAVKQIQTLHLNEIPFLTQHNISQLRNLKNLTEFYFNAEEITLSVCDLLVAILDDVPKLRHLKVERAYRFGQNTNVVNKLVTSSLRSLIINFKFHAEDCFAINEYTSYNDTLEILDLDPSSCEHALGSFFIKYFRKLRRLTFTHRISRNELEDIRIHQENLESLTVNLETDNYDSTNHSLGLQLFSFRQFKYLQCLKLTIVSFKKRFSFSDFVLPQLKYLNVGFYIETQAEEKDYFSNVVLFLRAIEKLPCLEFLKIQYDCGEIPPSFDAVFRQCKAHENLEYLFFNKFPSTEIENRWTRARRWEVYDKMVQMLDINKSLRFLSYQGISLCRDFISMEIIDITSKDSHFGHLFTR